jgi:hypothetical protein
VIVAVPFAMAKVRATFAAGSWLLSPPWAACDGAAPGAGDRERGAAHRALAREGVAHRQAELTVAPSVIGASPNVRPGSSAKVIACRAFAITSVPVACSAS